MFSVNSKLVGFKLVLRLFLILILYLGREFTCEADLTGILSCLYTSCTFKREKASFGQSKQISISSGLQSSLLACAFDRDLLLLAKNFTRRRLLCLGLLEVFSMEADFMLLESGTVLGFQGEFVLYTILLLTVDGFKTRLLSITPFILIDEYAFALRLLGRA